MVYQSVRACVRKRYGMLWGWLFLPVLGLMLAGCGG